VLTVPFQPDEVLGTDHTASAVDLDQILNIFGPHRCFVQPAAPDQPQGTPQVDKRADYSK
jgi:hypothetical protein